MEVKGLIEKLSQLDQERDIWLGYDYPHDVQEPNFVTFGWEHYQWEFHPVEKRLRNGDYIHFAE